MMRSKVVICQLNDMYYTDCLKEARAMSDCYLQECGVANVIVNNCSRYNRYGLNAVESATVNGCAVVVGSKLCMYRLYSHDTIQALPNTVSMSTLGKSECL